jgi:hypothetical protein
MSEEMTATEAGEGLTTEIGEAARGSGTKRLVFRTKEEIPIIAREKNTGSQGDLIIGIFYNLKRSLKIRVMAKTDPKGKTTLA